MDVTATITIEQFLLTQKYDTKNKNPRTQIIANTDSKYQNLDRKQRNT